MLDGGLDVAQRRGVKQGAGTWRRATAGIPGQGQHPSERLETTLAGFLRQGDDAPGASPAGSAFPRHGTSICLEGSPVYFCQGQGGGNTNRKKKRDPR